MIVLPYQPPAIVAPASRELPFHLDGYLIVLDVAVNNKPARLLLDTAAGTSLITKKGAARLGLKSLGEVQIQGGGEKTASAQYTILSRVTCGTATATGIPAVILDLPPGAKSDYDGILGNTFTTRYIVQIDYAKQRVRFFDKESFQPPADATALPMRLRSNIPEVDATIDGLSGRVRVDTGYAGALTFTSPTVTQAKLGEKYPKQLESVLGMGLGGMTLGKSVRIGELSLGGLALKSVVAGLSTDTKGALADDQTIALLGGEALSRFTVTFDFPGKRLFITKNTDFDKPFIFGRGGISGLMEPEGYRLHLIVPDSPASDAKLAVGELLLTIDDKAVTTLGLGGLRATLRQPVGTVLRLTVRSKSGEVRTVALTLRELL